MGVEKPFGRWSGTVNGRFASAQLATPLIEICGDGRVLIENHQGVVGYGSNEIVIKVRYGRICVNGEHLKLIKMSKEKLVITGHISGVCLQRRN